MRRSGRRNRDDAMIGDELPDGVERVLRRLKKFRGRWVIDLERREHADARLRGVDGFYRRLKSSLVFLPIGFRNLQQPIERQIDRFARREVSGVGVRSEREGAGRLWHQILLQERLV